MLARTPKITQDAPKMPPSACMCAILLPKNLSMLLVALMGSKMAPRWLWDAPSWQIFLQCGLNMAQLGLNMASTWLNMAQFDLNMVQLGPIWPQHGSTWPSKTIKNLEKPVVFVRFCEIRQNPQKP